MVLNGSSETPDAVRARSALALQDLCKWAVTASDTPLPEAVRARAALVLLDDLGAMVAASQEPEVTATRQRASAKSHAHEATVFGPQAVRLDRLQAATANGMAAAWCELDEGYRLAPCHAGAYVLPTLLAEAEARDLSSQQVLQLLAVGYEVTARFARAFPFPAMTVHPHAAFATVGAVVASALAQGLDAPTFLRALTGACSMSFAGPYRHAVDGALVRNAWTAASPSIAALSVEWAQDGIGGIAETPYDVFSTCFHTACDPDQLNTGLGGVWAINDGYHKVFACCQYAHAMLEASLSLHEQLGASARTAIASIEIETHPRGLTLTGTQPDNVLAAQFSMPHAAAAVAVLATGGQAAFSAAALARDDIAALRDKVTLKPYQPLAPWPNDRPSRVTWIMKDGARHTAEKINARGGADQPFDEATLLGKLAENTASLFPAMAGVLTDLLHCRHGVDHLSWRDCVGRMTAS
jgi:2-methylcitrate dehydratase PrpD